MKKNNDGFADQTQKTFSLRELFNNDGFEGVSKFRFYLLRIYYAVIILLLGIEVWSEVLTHSGIWKPLPAVAYSFWAAFTALSILGILHPLKMIPLLLVQFSYKLIWLIIVAYPLWSADQLTDSSAMGLTSANSIGIIIDIMVIPWTYVFKNYILINKVHRQNI
ncbi:MAG: hypothetical protein JSS91_08905 [Bacteroidetes bacterium]|nr:hypothetical protein [Bacteroidota bacterium]